MRQCYDVIAPTYDKIYKDKVSLVEDSIIKQLLTPLVFGSFGILDVGCGTGLFLEMFETNKYFGVDPSKGMLRILLKKFPSAKVKECRFEEYCGSVHDKVVISLYGGISYVPPAYLALDRYGEYFFMFYQEDHSLKCFENLSVDLLQRYALLEYNLQGAYTYKFSNYHIVTSRELNHASLQEY